MSNLYVSLEEVIKLIKKYDEKYETISLHKMHNQAVDLPTINLSEEQLDLIKKSV